MADQIFSWALVVMICVGLGRMFWPSIKEWLFKEPAPVDTTPSGMTVYSGRSIDLSGLKGKSFSDCIFVDVNFTNEAVVHLRGGNVFMNGYEVKASERQAPFIEADEKESIVGAVQFDDCLFVKSRIRTSRIASSVEVLRDLGIKAAAVSLEQGQQTYAK